MTATIILDADSIAYRAASANETRSIRIQEVGSDKIQSFTNRTAFREHLKTTKHTEDLYTITDVQEPNNVAYGKNAVREMIKTYQNKTGVRNTEIYISGNGNFRDDLELPMVYTVTCGAYAGRSVLGGKYKENRDSLIRPVQLKEIRSFMVNSLGAIPVDGMEVDDVQSIRAYEGWQRKERVIQVTADKDALQCAGWLFNPDKMIDPINIQGFGELHKEGKGIKGTGRLWLYMQSLNGDLIDNYRPSDLWKIEQDKLGKNVQFGEMAAYNILKDCKDDKEALQALVRQYKTWYPLPTTYVCHNGQTLCKDAVGLLQVYFDAARMLRWKGDKVDIKNVMDKLGIEYV